MRSVKVEYTTTGSDPKAEMFSVTLEGKVGERWETRARNQNVVPGEDGVKTYMLELGERLIIEPSEVKSNMVFDKEQNANIRVPDEAEQNERKEREAKAAKHQADQAVAAAEAKVTEAQDSAAKAENDANAGVKKAEADRAKIEVEAAKNRAAASEQVPSGDGGFNTGVAGPQTKTAPANKLPEGSGAQRAGNPASANTGPIDSKQVKNDTPSQSSSK